MLFRRTSDFQQVKERRFSHAVYCSYIGSYSFSVGTESVMEISTGDVNASTIAPAMFKACVSCGIPISAFVTCGSNSKHMASDSRLIL